MAYTQNIILSSVSQTINILVPCSVTIDPSPIQSSNKIIRIIYDFGDGTIINQSLIPSYIQSTDPSLPYPNEPGDPRNFKQKHDYSLFTQYKKVITINVFVYENDIDVPVVYTIVLNLSVPSLEHIDKTSGISYFDEIHLVGSRMFGTTNNLIYFFESINPNYLLPVFVNWQSKAAPNKIKISGTDFIIDTGDAFETVETKSLSAKQVLKKNVIIVNPPRTITKNVTGSRGAVFSKLPVPPSPQPKPAPLPSPPPTPPPVPPANLNNLIFVTNLGNKKILDYNINGSLSATSVYFIYSPTGISFNKNTQTAYISLNESNSIVKLSGTTATTFVTGLSSPYGSVLDSSGNLYVANYTGNAITKVTPAGIKTIFANSSKGIKNPFDITIDSSNNLYVSNYGFNNILKITPTSTVTVYASGFKSPQSLDIDSSGNLLVLDRLNLRIAMVTKTGIVSSYVDKTTDPSLAALNGCFGLSLDSSNNIYVSDYVNNKIMQITTDKKVYNFSTSTNL